jgi:hypothetical protein
LLLRVKDEDLDDLVMRFKFDAYNQQATVGENLLFGALKRPLMTNRKLAAHTYIQALLKKTGLDDELYKMGLEIAENTVELFSRRCRHRSRGHRPKNKIGDIRTNVFAPGPAGGFATMPLTASEKVRNFSRTDLYPSSSDCRRCACYRFVGIELDGSIRVVRRGETRDVRVRGIRVLRRLINANHLGRTLCQSVICRGSLTSAISRQVLERKIAFYQIIGTGPDRRHSQILMNTSAKTGGSNGTRVV